VFVLVLQRQSRTSWCSSTSNLSINVYFSMGYWRKQSDELCHSLWNNVSSENWRTG